SRTLNDHHFTKFTANNDEETRQEEEESFDLIPRTLEGSEDESNDEEDQELRLSEEARIQEEEEADELYPFRFDERLRSFETSFFEYRQTNPFVDDVSAIPDRGSKRQKEGGEHASASTPSKTATRVADRTTKGSQSRQLSATAQGDAQSWISDLTRQTDARSSFNELLDTPIDFSNFIMNRLNVDTLTPELLAGPTYELMRWSCNSLTELEYHLEEPLPLIPDNRGRRVIPFDHFVNNDLEYLWGGASSRKYTTSVTKTKAADYGHIKWIEDLVPRAMWIQQPSHTDVTVV
nr:hypothetical protein [Tanacetum cinerariifolium]